MSNPLTAARRSGDDTALRCVLPRPIPAGSTPAGAPSGVRVPRTKRRTRP